MDKTITVMCSTDVLKAPGTKCLLKTSEIYDVILDSNQLV